MSNKQWEEIIEHYYDRIYRYCLQFLGSTVEAQDAAQEVFLKAFQALEHLKDDTALKAWLYSIARNTCLDRRRWWSRYLRTLSNDTTYEVPAAAQDPDFVRALAQLIAQLPRRQREVFILRHWHDFSTEETGKLLGLSSGTVKVHLKRAIEKIKTGLKENNVL